MLAELGKHHRTHRDPQRLRGLPDSHRQCTLFGAKHPVTRRPLAVMVLAAAMPPRKRKIPISTIECADAAASAAAAVKRQTDCENECARR